MTATASPLDTLRLTSRLVICGTIRFDTAWRIGTGREGQTMSDLGVMLDPEGTPLLPGSTLKGKLRSTCESLAGALNLTACFLDFEVSRRPCTSDVRYYSTTLKKDYDAVRKTNGDSAASRLAWIEEHTCDVCKLFGSPVKAARLRIGDGSLVSGTWAGVVQVRDGVVIDRDSHTAVDGLKYDYEVVPAGAAYTIRIDMENPSEADLALVGAALYEWNAGSTLGGFTSRGLGRFRLETATLNGVRFDDAAERIRYLTNTGDARLTKRDEPWDVYFAKPIDEQVKKTRSASGGSAPREV